MSETPASPTENTLAAPPLTLTIVGKERAFDINDPKLPKWVKTGALTSGGYPYDAKLDGDVYEETLTRLQIELVKLVAWMQHSGERAVVLFEGRDAAGKGGTISVLHEHMNPRSARIVALSKPTEQERTQWYFQRYIAHFPSGGEFVSYDRSWYNRGVVEPVMGFCTPAEHNRFLDEAPRFEKSIQRDGIRFFKIWLDIGHEMQLKRFHDRRHSPLTNWKFSPIDIAGMAKWDEYSQRRDEMIKATHTDHAPWTIVRSNDKRRARIEVMRHLLQAIPYEGRDEKVIGEPDKRIIGSGAGFLNAD